MKKLAFLQKKYPRFIYQKYSYRLKGGKLKASFYFKIEPDISFKTKIAIKNIPDSVLDKKEINNLVFHMGLAEMPSYWKTTCSPEITIRAGYLSEKQISWWKGLLIGGLGQFFYENKIDWKKPDFLKINVNQSIAAQPVGMNSSELQGKYLVPFAGGRDSIVTLEALKTRKKEITLFMVNPTKQIKKAARITGIKNQIIVERIIDKRLLKLNKKGYLNGHTPFTAVLSFLAAGCAVLTNCKNVVFSNEQSADEGNVKYLGEVINHQWAKSSKFEKNFKSYGRKYLARNLNYFSFLRKYSEFEISKIFSNYPKYFPYFSSCNQGMKIGESVKEKWCGQCSKCLFVYLTLYPFLKKKEILKIFGKDLFENKKLLPVLQSLVGRGKTKPFECVGTYQESRLALRQSAKKAEKEGKLPYLLRKINENKRTER